MIKYYDAELAVTLAKVIHLLKPAINNNAIVCILVDVYALENNQRRVI